MTFIPVTIRLPPACQHILAAVKKGSGYETVKLYVGTHPRECVEDDGVVAWMPCPVYKGEPSGLHINHDSYDRGPDVYGKVEFCPMCGESAVVNACDCIP